MSKIGRQPVIIPQGVTVEVSGSNLKVTGPKGSLEIKIPRGVEVKVVAGQAEVSVKGNGKQMMSLHGTIRSILANNVRGVSEGWSKSLELIGTGYRAEAKGKDLNLTVGFSHTVDIKGPEGINFKIEKNVVTIEGANKEVVGQVAANIRSVRPPEPYKGKGIKYIDEVIRRKPGKAAAKTAGAAG